MQSDETGYFPPIPATGQSSQRRQSGLRAGSAVGPNHLKQGKFGTVVIDIDAFKVSVPGATACPMVALAVHGASRTCLAVEVCDGPLDGEVAADLVKKVERNLARTVAPNMLTWRMDGSLIGLFLRKLPGRNSQIIPGGYRTPAERCWRHIEPILTQALDEEFGWDVPMDLLKSVVSGACIEAQAKWWFESGPKLSMQEEMAKELHAASWRHPSGNFVNN